MSRITTVIFDVGGVLTTYTRENYFIRKGYSEEKAAALTKATMENPFWHEFDRGVFTADEVVDLLVKCTPELEDDIRASMKDHEGIVLRKDTAIPWIRSLKKRGIRVLYLSNFSEVAMEHNKEALDFVPETDGGIFSCEDQLIKPDPAIYQLLITRYHLKPEECVFIDDTFYNLPMAEYFGIHTILYKDQAQAEKDLEAMLSKMTV